MSERKARVFLAFLLGTTATYYGVLYAPISQHRYNYVYQGSVDLNRHIVSNGLPVGKRGVFFLGSSAVSGSNIPPETTVADYYNCLAPNEKAYNLGIMGASIFESLIEFMLASAHVHPSLVIYGMTPHNFEDTPSNLMIYRHLDEIRNLLSPEIAAPVERYRNLQAIPWVLGGWLPQIIPSPAQLRFFTWQQNLIERIYGPHFSKVSTKQATVYVSEAIKPENQTPELLGVLKSLADGQGARLLAYFEPAYHPDETFGAGRFAIYREKVVRVLKREGIPYLDYSDLIPQDCVYFIDYAHLTPLGNQMLADHLVRDVRRLLR